MKKYKNKHTFSSVRLIILTIIGACSLQACDSYGSEWPDEASIADVTPPKADFIAKVNIANNKTVDFTNASTSATTYAWDFGDGAASIDANPSHDYADFGTYTVSLTASDKLGVQNIVTKEVLVEKPLDIFKPTILNAGFESGTDNWLNSALGGAPQITGSPVFVGTQAGKFPSDGSRIAYQTITVEKNKIYSLSFYYTLKTSPAGSLNVAVLAGEVNTLAAVASATLASTNLTDQTDANAYVQGVVNFNSGDNSSISILVTNESVEARIDDFVITPQ